ncbi:MAG: AsmA family protein [Proteobacteria bacterium]|nr:AsmA family protein [Pseudomonadota bacterium]
MFLKIWIRWRKMMAKQTDKSSTTKIVLTIIVLTLMLPVVGISLFLSTFDINSYRGQIEKTVHDKIGRTVSLKGPITWSFSLQDGFSVSVEDVTIDNPSWASRENMAAIGSAKLHVEIVPLLQKKLNIIAFTLDKADILLETAPSGETNWALTTAAPATNTKKAEDKAKTSPTESAAPIAIDVREVSISDSRFGMRDAKGKTSVFDVPTFKLTSSGKGTMTFYSGSIAGKETELQIEGGKLDEVTGPSWPFNARIAYGDMKISAVGTLKQAKTVDITSYNVSAGRSTIEGVMLVQTGGARPQVKGTINSAALTPSDFAGGAAAPAATSESANKEPAADNQASTSESGKVFSQEPIDLSGLQSVDADLQIQIEELPVGDTSLDKLKAKVALNAGKLSVTPLTAELGGTPVNMMLNIDSNANPPALSLKVKTDKVDMAKFVSLGGAESAFLGKSDVDMSITTMGNSLHDFASYANGYLNLTMDAAEVSSSTLRDIAGTLLQLFAPGVSDVASMHVNCMALRTQITQGLMESKGLLMDSNVTTIAGDGYINLADERVNLALRTRPKNIGIGSILPSMNIRGTLANPSFEMDKANALAKVTGLLNGAASDDGVPVIATAPAGQNACVLTLANPFLAQPKEQSHEVLLPKGAGGAAEKVNKYIKDLGDKLFQ